MRNLSSFLVLIVSVGLLLAACGSGAAPAGPPAGVLERDPRLEQRVELPAGELVPMTLVFSALSRDVRLGLVALGEDLKQPLKLEKANPTARELLRLLEVQLEGEWRREGDLYVLGPPRGLEEIAGLHPVRFQEYSDRQGRKLVQEFKAEEWRRLRTRQAIPFKELRPELQGPVRELARCRYWLDRQQGRNHFLRLEHLEKELFRLYVAPCIEHPGEEVLSVAICIKAGTETWHWQYYHFR